MCYDRYGRGGRVTARWKRHERLARVPAGTHRRRLIAHLKRTRS
jgi:hypothetical protein